MESIALLKMKQDQQALDKVHRVMFQKKDLMIQALIQYLREQRSDEYEHFVVQDADGNVADILALKGSQLFQTEVSTKDYLEYNIENIIDKRMFDNEKDIIILDITGAGEYLNLGYLCESLDYPYVTYSKELKETLERFVEYVLEKEM